MIQSLHCLVYGESGTGKTTFASTFPGPILWLVCSGGNKPGELRSIDTPENRGKITPVVINSTQQMAAEVKRGAGFATTVLDHASGLADLTLKEILGLDELPAQKRWGLAQQQQYGEQALRLKETFRALLNLPGNVVILAQQRTFGGKDDGLDPDLLKPTVGAALTPSVTGWLNPACDYVLQTYKRPKYATRKNVVAGKTIETQERVRGVEYCLRCEPHDVFMTKFRLPRGRELPESIVDPDYVKLIAVIEGGE